MVKEREMYRSVASLLQLSLSFELGFEQTCLAELLQCENLSLCKCLSVDSMAAAALPLRHDADVSCCIDIFWVNYLHHSVIDYTLKSNFCR